jgi:cobalamin biosynthesis Mg chelatase CobN
VVVLVVVVIVVVVVVSNSSSSSSNSSSSSSVRNSTMLTVYVPDGGRIKPKHVGCVDERRTIRNSVCSGVKISEYCQTVCSSRYILITLRITFTSSTFFRRTRFNGCSYRRGQTKP